MILQGVNLFGLILVATLRPYLVPLTNRLWIFNDFMLIMLIYPMLVFTDYVNDPFIKYHLAGNSYIIFVCILIMLNFIFLIKNLLYFIILMIIRIYRKIKFRL